MSTYNHLRQQFEERFVDGINTGVQSEALKRLDAAFGVVVGRRYNLTSVLQRADEGEGPEIIRACALDRITLMNIRQVIAKARDSLSDRMIQFWDQLDFSACKKINYLSDKRDGEYTRFRKAEYITRETCHRLFEDD
jgi:hypothetical protein